MSKKLLANGSVFLLPAGEPASSQLAGINDFQATRTAVGVDDDGNLLLIVVDAITLHDLAVGLVEMKPVLGIVDALNLDGSSSSGLMYRSRKSGDYVTVANSHSLIASAIAIRASSKPFTKKKQAHR